MHRTSRRSRITAVAAAAVSCLLVTATSYVGTTTATAADPGSAQSVAGRVAGSQLAPPGPYGSAIVLEDQASFYGFDIAFNPISPKDFGFGRTAVAWISDSLATPELRVGHLCVFSESYGNACVASGQWTFPLLDGSSASGIQAEPTPWGSVRLVWFYQSGSTGKLAMAEYLSGTGVLVAPQDAAYAPSNGMLLDVETGPDGKLWAVTRNDSSSGHIIQVHQGLGSTPQTLTAPWLVGKASLAFAGSKPILLIAKYGSIADPLYYASGTPWTGFAPVPKTWTLGDYNDLVSTKKGVRMIGSENNANYRPVVGRWTGSGFSTPQLIGDNQSCPALTHDLVTDDSGRLADVSERCGQLNVYNLPDTKNAAITMFPSGGTIAGAPQIGTSPRGYGYVAWTILSPVQGSKLLVRPVRLPALMKEKSAQEKDNKVTVRGPVSCLPVVTVTARVKANAAPGWDLVSRQLRLDGDDVGTSVKINGEALAWGSEHVLLGKGVFKKDGQTVTVTEKLGFEAC